MPLFPATRSRKSKYLFQSQNVGFYFDGPSWKNHEGYSYNASLGPDRLIYRTFLILACFRVLMDVLPPKIFDQKFVQMVRLENLEKLDEYRLNTENVFSGCICLSVNSCSPEIGPSCWFCPILQELLDPCSQANLGEAWGFRAYRTFICFFLDRMRCRDSHDAPTSSHIAMAGLAFDPPYI